MDLALVMIDKFSEAQREKPPSRLCSHLLYKGDNVIELQSLNRMGEGLKYRMTRAGARREANHFREIWRDTPGNGHVQLSKLSVRFLLLGARPL